MGFVSCGSRFLNLKSSTVSTFRTRPIFRPKITSASTVAPAHEITSIKNLNSPAASFPQLPAILPVSMPVEAPGWHYLLSEVIVLGYFMTSRRNTQWKWLQLNLELVEMFHLTGENSVWPSGMQVLLLVPVNSNSHWQTLRRETDDLLQTAVSEEVQMSFDSGSCFCKVNIKFTC